MPEDKSFWATVPGILTGIAGVIAALTSLYIAIRTRNKDKNPSPHEAIDSQKPSLPQLTMSTWTLQNAIDDAYDDWSGSTLTFTSQVESEDGLELRGKFEWMRGGHLEGTEDVEGTYDRSTRKLSLKGNLVRKVKSGATVKGKYTAVLSADALLLRDGAFGGEGVIPGRWQATR